MFGTPEINVGLWPYMITVPLLRSMPPKTVLDLMMTGRRVAAEEGARIGFVQRVVPVAELDATVDALAAELASKSPIIMRWGRDAFYRVLEMDADAALAYLQSMLTVTSQTEDAAEGVAAFAEKRAPQWKGRLSRWPTRVTTGARSSAISRRARRARSRWAARSSSSGSVRSAS